MTTQRNLFELLRLPKQDFTPQPEHVRLKLDDILQRLRSGEAIQEPVMLMWRAVFPQMTNWLPDDEAERYRAAFTFETWRASKRAA